MLDRLIFGSRFSFVASWGCKETISPFFLLLQGENVASARGERARDSSNVTSIPWKDSIEEYQPPEETEDVAVEASLAEIRRWRPGMERWIIALDLSIVTFYP
jgi:hypothetical protein